MNYILRLASLLLLLVLWQLASTHFGPRLLPAPFSVLTAITSEARSGALFANLTATLARVAVSFFLAMSFGAVIGIAMGGYPALDRITDPWIVILINLPSLVIIVLVYVMIRLYEGAW